MTGLLVKAGLLVARCKRARIRKRRWNSAATAITVTVGMLIALLKKQKHLWAIRRGVCTATAV